MLGWIEEVNFFRTKMTDCSVAKQDGGGPVEEVFHSLAHWEKKKLQYLRLLMERRVANVCGARGKWMSGRD